MNKTRTQKNIGFFAIFILIAFIILTSRLVWLQFVKGQHLVEQAQTQLREDKEIQSPRGTIFDRNGRELAVSVVTKSLYANPTEVGDNIDKTAEVLAGPLGVKPEYIKERLKWGGCFVWLKRTLDPPVAQNVIALIKENNLKGLYFKEESKRYYPNEVLGAQVLGFVGTDDVGLNGIEMTFDKKIKGWVDKRQIETDSYGKPIYSSVFSMMPPKQGKNITLTIDSTIQFIIEQALDKVMTDTKARGATIIVMNTKTGEILGMANRPTYNPNYFYVYGPNEWKNRAISVVYEPGSTFKAIVAAAAIEEGVVSPDERMQDNGFIEVSGRKIRNWSGESYGNISFTDVIKNSINTGFVEVGLRLGGERLNKYARAFGFGKAVDIELPGEEDGILFKTADMRAVDVATMAIGQGIAVTPLQLITAISAIANDGVLLKPYIVKEIKSLDGTVDFTGTTQVVRQAISPETAKKMKPLLEKVVSEGGGVKAQVKGYRFAGKTGTAERLSDSGIGYEPGKYIASFAGFGPIDDPQIAALIIIDSPQGMYYGGMIAAPVFQEIMTNIVRYLNIPPDIPVLIPPAKKSAPANQKINTAPAIVPGKVIVPDVVGKSMREAGELILKNELVFIPEGSGIAVRQSISPNTVVDKQTELKVYFEHR